MIQFEVVKNIVEEKLKETEIFVVEMQVSVSNHINIFIDSFEGVRIEDCISLSRAVENNLDREIEDYELLVSSYGIDQPFKIVAQYRKNIGRLVEVVDSTGIKSVGTLLEAGDDDFKITMEVKEAIDGKKKKQVVSKEFIYKYENIKSTKLKISFK